MQERRQVKSLFALPPSYPPLLQSVHRVSENIFHLLRLQVTNKHGGVPHQQKHAQARMEANTVDLGIFLWLFEIVNGRVM